MRSQREGNPKDTPVVSRLIESFEERLASGYCLPFQFLQLIQKHPQIKTTDILVLAVIDSHDRHAFNHKMPCDLSCPQIARMLGKYRTTVESSIARLRSLGVVKTKEISMKGRRAGSCRCLRWTVWNDRRVDVPDRDC